LSSGAPQRSLPPLPTTAANHDGYTRLNSFPENASSGDDTNLVGSGYEEAPQHGPADPAGFQNQCSMEEVDCIGKDNGASAGIIITIPQMESSQTGGLDAGGFLHILNVPYTEDASKVDEMVDDGCSEKVQQSGGGDRGNGLDANGYLMLHHVPSPKNVRKVDDYRSENGVEPNLTTRISPRVDAHCEDRKTGYLKIQDSPSSRNLGGVDNTRCSD